MSLLRRACALVATAATCVVAGCDFASPPPPRAEELPSAIVAPLQASNAEAAELYRVVETWFNEYLALNPVFASELGDHRFDDRFGDYASASWMADSLGIEQEALERLAAVDPRQLRGDDLVSYEAFKRERELTVYGFRYPGELLAIDSLQNWGVVFARLASGDGVHTFRSTQDYDRFLTRMDGFVAWTEQTINNLRAGVSKGIVLPKVVVEHTLPQLEAFARIEDPRQSVFWRPLLSFPPGPSVADRQRLLREYDVKLRTQVLPAYRRLHDYLAQEYLPRARDTIAWADLPSGDYWYAWLVRYHTTLDLTADDVHAMGLREVTRLRANLARLQPALDVEGAPRVVFETLRADPRFQGGDVATLLAAYASLQRRVTSNMPALFLRQPRSPLAIRPIEGCRPSCAALVSYQAPSADGARPAVLQVDTQAPASHPTYEMDAVFLHEALPGRHYQTAMAQETANLPSFRRFGRHPAYVEGWALYAETLGSSLGLYADPYTQAGALSRQLLYAARLVVDTGIHAKRWERERAVEYLRVNTALAETDIAAEVDRCIARPGQVLAYKVGELKLLDLQRKAEQRLGGRFDLREFHEQVVASGPVPLSVLEARIDRWLAQRR